jgi:hypothetical protein
MHTLKDLSSAGWYFFIDPDYSLQALTQFRESNASEIGIMPHDSFLIIRQGDPQKFPNSRCFGDMGCAKYKQCQQGGGKRVGLPNESCKSSSSVCSRWVRIWSRSACNHGNIGQGKSGTKARSLYNGLEKAISPISYEFLDLCYTCIIDNNPTKYPLITRSPLQPTFIECRYVDIISLLIGSSRKGHSHFPTHYNSLHRRIGFRRGQNEFSTAPHLHLESEKSEKVAIQAGFSGFFGRTQRDGVGLQMDGR